MLSLARQLDKIARSGASSPVRAVNDETHQERSNRWLRCGAQITTRALPTAALEPAIKPERCPGRQSRNGLQVKQFKRFRSPACSEGVGSRSNASLNADRALVVWSRPGLPRCGRCGVVSWRNRLRVGRTRFRLCAAACIVRGDAGLRKRGNRRIPIGLFTQRRRALMN